MNSMAPNSDIVRVKTWIFSISLDLLPRVGLESFLLSVDVEHSFGNSDAKECGSRKRVRSGSSCGSGSDSKACREKMRRDKLNDRSHELCSILEPGRTPKMDKAVILSDAVQMLTQLRDESQKLKDSCDSLQGKINELKAEKNELREEKQKLKMGKENFCFAAIKSARHSTRLLSSPFCSSFSICNSCKFGGAVY